MRASHILLVVLLAAVLMLGAALVLRGRHSGAAAGPGMVVVYAPCGLQGPIQQAAGLFRKQHPEIPLQVVYDNANILVRRVVKQGERPDIFLSPGELELTQLVEAGLIDTATVHDFGSLDMVLIAPVKNLQVTKIEDLASRKIERVALGDPAFNSVGLYGQQVLKARRVWEAVEPKLVLREQPLEAFKEVAEGNAAAGFAYLTCPLDTNPEKASKSDVRIVEKISRDTYGPIRLQAGALNTTKQPPAARVFLDFLISKEAQQVMSRDGVLPVEVLQK